MGFASFSLWPNPSSAHKGLRTTVSAMCYNNRNTLHYLHVSERQWNYINHHIRNTYRPLYEVQCSLACLRKQSERQSRRIWAEDSQNWNKNTTLKRLNAGHRTWVTTKVLTFPRTSPIPRHTFNLAHILMLGHVWIKGIPRLNHNTMKKGTI